MLDEEKSYIPYRDNEDEIGATNYLLEPRPVKKCCNKRKVLVRGALGLLGLYLVLRSWSALSSNSGLDERNFGCPSEGWFLPEDGSDDVHPPHRPFPFPRGPRHHPFPPPPHPPTVLGCSPLSTSLAENSNAKDSAEVTVSLDEIKNPVLLVPSLFIEGDLSVVRTADEDSDESPSSDWKVQSETGKELKVKVKVQPAENKDGLDAILDEEEPKLLLCVLSFSPIHHGPPHSTNSPPHHPPPHTRLIVDILPALNETYPKFPEPHHPPHKAEHDDDDANEEGTTMQAPSFVARIWSTLFGSADKSVTRHPGRRHRRPHHRRPFPHLPFPHHPPHPHPYPPKPPVDVLETDITLPVSLKLAFAPPHP